MSSQQRSPGAAVAPPPWPAGGVLDADDIANAYRMFLGRPPESDAAVAAKRALTPQGLVEQLLGSSEFDEQLFQPIRQRRGVSAERFAATPDKDLLAWAARFLPLTAAGAQALAASSVWYSVYEVMLEDPELGPALSAIKPALGSEAFRSGLETLREAETTRKIVGGVDDIQADRISGWAMNASQPGERLAVTLLIDGRPAGAGVTGLFRRDLQDVHGGDGRYGFEIGGFAPLDTDTPSPTRIEVLEAASQVLLGAGRLNWSRQAQASQLDGLRDELREARAALARVEQRLDDASRGFGFPLALYDDYHRAYYLRTPADAAREVETQAAFRWRPRFAVICPIDAWASHEVEPLARSLATQSYGEWTLALVAEEPGSLQAAAWAQRAQAIAPGRVSAGPFQPALAISDMALLLAPGEVLAPDALHCVAAALQAPDGRPRLVYADEDHLEETPDGRRRCSRPILRTAYDPLLLLQQNALCGLLAVEAPLLDQALAQGGSLTPGGRHDLVLRLTEALPLQAVRHLPRVLGHLAADTPDAAADIDAVRRHMERGGKAGSVQPADEANSAAPLRLRVRWADPAGTRAAVIIPTRDRLDLLGPCLVSLLALQARNHIPLQIIVVDNGGEAEQTRAFLRALNVAARTTQLSWDRPFNWAAINNFAAGQTDADVLIFLNDDTVALTPDWSDELCRQVLQPGIGAVGARLLYEDGTIQHAGMVFAGRTAPVAHEGVGARAGEPGYLGRHALLRRVSAVTGACLATAAAAFRQVGGFDEAAFAVEANDVDYCLRLEQAGLATLYDPDCTFYHFESKSRGYTSTDPERMRSSREALERLQRRWGERLAHDPYYNPHFDRFSRPFSQLGAPAEL